MQYTFDLTEAEERHALAVLKPTGYRLLVALGHTSEKIGSVILPESRRDDETVASILGKVIAVGRDAYRDANRFPGGQYCAPGDIVMMASYTGRRFKIKDREYRLINDDSVMAVVHKPDEVTRA